MLGRRVYAFPSAGAFNCRAVKETGNRSAHAWGAAIDINVKFADYWLWAKNGDYRNRIPFDIVDIFERIDPFLAALEGMIGEGLVTVSAVHILRYLPDPKP